MYDGVIIGGGPAGMFASIIAAQQGYKVLLLERNDRLGKKLLITGKGRCNVTNACSAQEVLQNVPRNGRFLYSAMESFPPSAIMEFLENVSIIANKTTHSPITIIFLGDIWFAKTPDKNLPKVIPIK